MEKSWYAADEGAERIKAASYPGGVKLTTKELRDYLAIQVSAQVTDPNTVKELMRHTSLTTTSRYVRTVTERMKEAVQNLGANPGGNSGGNSPRKNTQKRMLIETVSKPANCAEWKEKAWWSQ